MTIKNYDFMKDRIRPREIASDLEAKLPINIKTPVSKLDRLFKTIPKYFNGKIKINFVARNRPAKELLSGAAAGGAIGLGIGMLVWLLKKSHPAVMIATTLIGMGVGYFVVKYKIEIYVKTGSDGEEYAHLKFRPEN